MLGPVVLSPEYSCSGDYDCLTIDAAIDTTVLQIYIVVTHEALALWSQISVPSVLCALSLVFSVLRALSLVFSVLCALSLVFSGDYC